MAKRKQAANLHQWVCKQLAGFYKENLKPSDLLAVKEIQRDVVVIGPDGRKFRLQNVPQNPPEFVEGNLEKSA
jgi:hypothetical protein